MICGSRNASCHPTSVVRPRPLVSIVVVSYNYARYLQDAIESALTQTYSPIEVIAVDDGSTDGSRDILELFSDRVTVVLKNHGGETSAVNTGFAWSRGDIVIFLDSDDMLDPVAVEQVVAAWLPSASKVQFCLSAIDAEGKSLRRKLPVYPPDFSAADARDLMLRFGVYPSPPTSGNAYSRAYLSRVLPLDVTLLPFGPDGALNAIAALYGDVVTLHRPFSFYRIHDRSMSATGRLDIAAIRMEIEAARQTSALLRSHASALGMTISDGRPLAHSMHLLERRLALSKIPSDGVRAGDNPLVLFWFACRCIKHYERGRVRAALKLSWFLITAISPRFIARGLLQYRFTYGKLPLLLRFIWPRR
jgi:glycosyltransferase involved in cell wall biosynthesis